MYHDREHGKANEGEVVHFHVHDSFRPSMLKREFSGGKAELILTAWGGFTVGAWIPGREVELELDLSKIARAPRNIRTK